VPNALRSLMPSGIRTATVALLIVLAAALVGQTLMVLVAYRLREALVWEPAQWADSVLGAVLGLGAFLIGVTFILAPAEQLPYPTLQRQIADSRVVSAIQAAVPPSTGDSFGSFRALLNQSGFPRVFSEGRELVLPVAAPDDAVVNTAQVRQAAKSIVRIIGVARSCGQAQEGTGFVFAPERVMTNAHVVAGVRRPLVQVGGKGRQYSVVVVYYDPQRDVAVLDVPGLNAPALHFSGPVPPGSSAVVAGFPEDGPYQVGAARIRQRLNADGADIYGHPGVVRSIYSMFAQVQPGNSGGPLLAPNGSVIGVVFARSVDDASTGYALTSAEVAAPARTGKTATERVSTDRCAG